MARARVLVVEDDESFQELYTWFFETAYKNEFEWRLAETGEKAVHLLQRKPFDLIVLDILLPGMSGLEVLRWREGDSRGRFIPALVVSGQTKVQDRLAGLVLGADDYLIKPFVDEELLVRLHALKRRRDRVFEEHGVYDIGWLKFNPETQELAVYGVFTHLEPKELELLIYFLRRSKIVHLSRALWDMFWDDDTPNFERVLANKISTLRTKLGRGGHCLLSHKGVGYSFDPSLILDPQP